MTLTCFESVTNSEPRDHRWPWLTSQGYLVHFNTIDCQNLQVYCICREINYSRTIGAIKRLIP